VIQKTGDAPTSLEMGVVIDTARQETAPSRSHTGSGRPRGYLGRPLTAELVSNHQRQHPQSGTSTTSTRRNRCIEALSRTLEEQRTKVELKAPAPAYTSVESEGYMTSNFMAQQPSDLQQQFGGFRGTMIIDDDSHGRRQVPDD